MHQVNCQIACNEKWMYILMLSCSRVQNITALKQRITRRLEEI